MKLVSAIFILFFIFATKSSAAVFINEIAWMGTVNSANDEWIEIYNDGSENIDLNGWTLSANDGTPSVNFSNLTNKIIQAGGFYLLERTDDNTVPGLEADLIYTGALSNDGEILVLKNTEGVSVHQVDGSDFWAIGGNLSTKETLQKISSGWITATGTPKSANAGQSSNQSSSSSSQESYSSSVSSVANSSAGGGSILWPDEPQIYANAGKDKTEIVGADVLFEGKALGIKKEPLQNARYLWNFGDGASGEGQNFKHIYKYPGNYIAVLDVSSGQYSTSDRANVKITANELVVSEANNEFIKLKNKSGAILDVSGWFLRVSGAVFKFPDYSLIAANSELMISSDVSGLKFSDNKFLAEILYPNGSIAFSYLPAGQAGSPISSSSSKPKEIILSKPQPIMPAAAVSSSSRTDKIAQIIQPPKPTTVVGFATTTQLANVIYSSEENKNGNDYKKWLYLALFLGLFSGGALFFVRRQSLS